MVAVAVVAAAVGRAAVSRSAAARGNAAARRQPDLWAGAAGGQAHSWASMFRPSELSSLWFT